MKTTATKKWGTYRVLIWGHWKSLVKMIARHKISIYPGRTSMNCDNFEV